MYVCMCYCLCLCIIYYVFLRVRCKSHFGLSHPVNTLFLLIIIGEPPIIVTIWKVVFANKSRKLGWIWMKLGRWG